ncbi:MAG TPA: Na+/H+ antiporter NhaA [Pseudomonadales bacterium]|nr:Na+/H+ antiporter NhaA [Pseudomonadales bacterium]
MQKHYPLEPLFGKILSPFEEFLRRTTAGGVILMFTTLATLILTYFVGESRLHHFWDLPLGLQLGERWSLQMSLHHWVNDGLMALFFLIVGLELKREMLVGELSSLRDAALPIIAAIGGMIVPAAIFSYFNAGTATAHGWGIPMATDIAFAISILVLMGSRVPKNLIIFLTALAIADDLGAVLVIALFYTAEIKLQAIYVALGVLTLLILLNRGGVRNPLPYWLLGILLWYFVLSSGIHATVAGIALAFCIPSRPSYTPQDFARHLQDLEEEFNAEASDESKGDAFQNQTLSALAEAIEHSATAVQSPLQRTEHNLNPWVTFLVIPIFALSNAGIDFSQLDFVSAIKEKLTLGILAGLVVGKFCGIALFSYIGVALKLGKLPDGVSWKHLLGAAWLGGIGFTMSLFVGQLAFQEEALLTQTKLGVLLASFISALIGLLWLVIASRRDAKL